MQFDPVMVCAFAIALAAGCDQTFVRAGASTAPVPTKHVKQFSGGVLIGEWETNWVDHSLAGGRFYFFDSKTGRRICITGDVQIY